MPRVSDVFADAKGFVIFLFLDSFRIQGNLSFPCFQTLSVFKGFCHFPVSRLFPYSKDFVNFLFPDSFCIQRILSFSCFQTLSVFKIFCRFPVSRHVPFSKTKKSLDFLHFHHCLHNSSKPSAAGARPGIRSVPMIS